jgi:hypothetical protein
VPFKVSDAAVPTIWFAVDVSKPGHFVPGAGVGGAPPQVI